MVTEIGIAYEVLFYVALKEAQRRHFFKGDIYWHERPRGINVVPDFLIGQDKDNPDYIFLVSHLTTSKESEKKGWRNLGELCEMKVSLDKAPIAIDVVFEAGIKPGVLAVQKACFDAVFLVEGKPYARKLFDWVRQISLDLPSEQAEMAIVMSERIKASSVLRQHMRQLVDDLKKVFMGKANVLSQLWLMDKKRERGEKPSYRSSFFRRGFAKRILIGDTLDGNKLIPSLAHEFVKFKLCYEDVSGYVVGDSELISFLSSKYASHYKEVSAGHRSEGFEKQLVKIRQLSFLFDKYIDYVIANLDELKTLSGMKKVLEQQWRDPSFGLSILPGEPAPTSVWIYSFISAVVCAKMNHRQAFGYSAFSKHPDGNVLYSKSVKLGEWCSRFACQFFNRKPTFRLPANALTLIARVLSEALLPFTVTDISELEGAIFGMCLSKEYEVGLLSHKGFDPLAAILFWDGVCDNQNAVKFQSCFAKRAGLAASVGTIDAFLVNRCAIRVQTANQLKHATDKRKELCARAIGLRYDWNTASCHFEKRKGVDRLILLIDGTWSKEHLQSLVNAGWDEIYYPDEIDKLKASVLGTKASKAVVVSPRRPVKETYEDEELREAAEEKKGYGKRK